MYTYIYVYIYILYVCVYIYIYIYIYIRNVRVTGGQIPGPLCTRSRLGGMFVYSIHIFLKSANKYVAYLEGMFVYITPIYI